MYMYVLNSTRKVRGSIKCHSTGIVTHPVYYYQSIKVYTFPLQIERKQIRALQTSSSCEQKDSQGYSIASTWTTLQFGFAEGKLGLMMANF